MSDFDPIAFRCPQCGVARKKPCRVAGGVIIDWFHAPREQLALLPVDDERRIRFLKPRAPRAPMGGLRKTFEHGTHASYVAGCHCEKCKAGHRAYYHQRKWAKRKGDWNGLVDAFAARKHLRQLSRKGIGRRAVSAVADVAATVLHDVATGRKTKIRARTEKKILGVSVGAAINDGHRIDAAPTWKKLNRLVDEGFTKAEIARRLGCTSPALHIRKDQINAKTAQRVSRFYKTIMEGA